MRTFHLAALGALLLVPLACGRAPADGTMADSVGGSMMASSVSGGMMGMARGGGMMGMRHGRTRPAKGRTASAPASSKVATIRIASVGNQMAFDTTRIEVKRGQKVHILFHNNATSAALPHNWVLVRRGTAAAVARAGLPRGRKGDYVAPGPNVLAYTPLADPGHTVQVTFTAPAAGSYTYICTVPGHYVLMRGTLVVTPEASAGA